jgi:hypothetical protein
VENKVCRTKVKLRGQARLAKQPINFGPSCHVSSDFITGGVGEIIK